MKENSIKNERSSIKEDIKILEKKIEDYEPYKNIEYCSHAGQILQEEHKAIEHILSDYKRVLEINEVLLKENEELHKETDRMKSLDIHKLVEDWETGQLIPIQKIKDKIEYLDNQQKQWLEDRELKVSDGEIIFAKDILKELLGKE